MAVVSIAAAVFVSVRAIRQRQKELELQSGGDVESPPPTLGGQMTSIKAQLDEQRAWCRKRYGKDWTATDYSARLAEARAALRPKTDAPVRAAGVAAVQAKNSRRPGKSRKRRVQARRRVQSGKTKTATKRMATATTTKDRWGLSGSGRRRRSQQPSSSGPPVQAVSLMGRCSRCRRFRAAAAAAAAAARSWRWCQQPRLVARPSLAHGQLLSEQAALRRLPPGPVEAALLSSDRYRRSNATRRTLTSMVAGMTLSTTGCMGRVALSTTGCMAAGRGRYEAQHEGAYGGEYGGGYEAPHEGL